MSGHDNGVSGVSGVNGSTGGATRGIAGRARVSRRAFVAGAGAASVGAWARRAAAQPKATITYWNGLTGADGKVMDELIDQFTRDSGIRIEQQRLPWADLYAKLQIAVPAGEGPDLALIHTVEVPHFASDGVLEVIDDATATGKGFRGGDYLPAMWQGGTFQGKRYSLPLDVPQHILYMNVKVMKEAGLVGTDGRPRVPAGRDEMVTMAKRIAAKADTFGFAIGTVTPGRYTWGFHNLLWQNGANIYTVDLKRAGVTDPAALEVAEFWAALEGQHKIAPPANANCRDAFIAGKLGMWIAGSWNFTGLREAKVEFVAVPVPRLFKQAVVWAMPHQYTFPKPKAADRAKRDAAWAHVRWMTDHVAEWTLKAGQVSASRKAHSDPRVTADPVLRALLSQAPSWQVGQPTPKWVAAENLTRPVIEAVYTGQKPPKAAMEDLARQINALPD
jgi:multiple sugar transport system substrate-binding protein